MTDMSPTSAEQKRERIYIRPTLIIGLGGSGARIATELKARLEEQLGEHSNYDKAIRMVCFDTANETFKASKPNTPGAMVELQAGSEFIRISDVPLYDLSKGRNANPAIARILPETLHSTQIDQGAQQVRRLGRVALFFHYNLIKSSLKRTLEDLRNRNRPNLLGLTPEGKEIYVPSSERTRVYIISSICGGTGSGMFLDIAYLVRHFSKPLGPVDVHGMLLLPEAFPEVGTTGEQRIRANAYAALLDLEYYNQATTEGRALYNVEFPGDPVEVDGRPFTNCYLLNDATIGGTAMYAPLLAEILQVMITSRVGEQLDATLDNIRGYLNVYEDGFRAFYSGIGLSQIVMPRAWQRQVFITELQKVWVNDILLVDKGENWGDNNSPSSEAEGFFARQSDDIKSIIADGLRPILMDALPNLSSLPLNNGDASQLASQLQTAFTEVETVFRNRIINNIENQARDALAKLKKTLRETVKTHVNTVSEKQQSRGLLWTRRWLRGLEKLLNEAIQAENNRLSFNQRAQQILNRSLTALRTSSNVPYLGRLQASRAAQTAKRQLVGFFEHEITLDSNLIRSHVIQCYSALLPLINELERDITLTISAWQDWVNQRNAPPAPNLAPLMISAINVANERDILQSAARNWAQEKASTEVFNPRIATSGKPAGIGELYDSTNPTQRLTVFTAFDNYCVESYIRHTKENPDDLPEKVTDTALKTIGEQAKPLTGYEKGLLKSNLREVKAFGARTRGIADRYMSKTGITPTDLSSVETGDSDRFQLFLTVHGIPAYALKGFTEYKRNYDALSARPDDPNSRYGIFHLDNERENSPYDPQSINFINLEDFEMRFARALAYGWIIHDTLFSLEGDGYASKVFAYPPTPTHELEKGKNLPINLYHEMELLALKKHTELSNQIQSATDIYNQLEDDDPQKALKQREIEQCKRQSGAIEHYFHPRNRPDQKPSHIKALKDSSNNKGYTALVENPNNELAGSLYEPLNALYADEERLLPGLFIAAFDEAYKRVIEHERESKLSAGETLAERVETFLTRRGIIGDDSSQLWFSQRGQTDRILEERLCSMLLVYHRSTQRQLNSPRYYQPDAVRIVKNASAGQDDRP